MITTKSETLQSVKTHSGYTNVWRAHIIFYSCFSVGIKNRDVYQSNERQCFQFGYHQWINGYPGSLTWSHVQGWKKAGLNWICAIQWLKLIYASQWF